MKIKNSKQGQALLITVMLIATVITVVMSATFKASTDTKTTQAQSESQKALSAAESAIEAQLKSGQNVNDINSISGINGLGLTGSVQFSTTTTTTFTTPVIQKDGAYTFYLADYKTGGTNYWTIFTGAGVYTGGIDVYYGQNGTGCDANNIALEITLIGTAGQIKRIADFNNIVNSNGSANASIASNASAAQDGVTYYCKASIGDIDGQAPNARLLVVRLISPGSQSTRLLLKATDNTTGLPLQGKFVTSTVSSTTTGLTKKVQLFQSYPQIPAELLVTSF